MGGTIVVSKDATGTEAALLYPAALTTGLTPASFFSSYLRYEQQVLAKEGVTLSFKMQPSTTGLPQASIDLRSSRALLAGEARVVVLPVRTQFGSQEAVFSAWWAPPSRWASDSAKLIAVRSCFSAAPADLFQVFRDQNFTYIMPTGWACWTRGRTTSTSAATATTPTSATFSSGYRPSTTPRRWRWPTYSRWTGITVTRVLSVTRLADQQVVGGRRAGPAVRGVPGPLPGPGGPRAGVHTHRHRPGGHLWCDAVGFSTTNLWNSVNGGLIEMMGAVQHSFVQDLPGHPEAEPAVAGRKRPGGQLRRHHQRSATGRGPLHRPAVRGPLLLLRPRRRRRGRVLRGQRPIAQPRVQPGLVGASAALGFDRLRAGARWR